MRSRNEGLSLLYSGLLGNKRLITVDPIHEAIFESLVYYRNKTSIVDDQFIGVLKRSPYELD